MKKILLFSFLGLFVGIVGFFVYNNFRGKTLPAPQVTKPASPVFSSLSGWIPNTTWSTPVAATEETSYGTLPGMTAEGKVSDPNTAGNDNLQDQPFMQELGFTKDYQFSADGPGASNWGYSKTENGKMQIVIFRYSTQHLLGPETTVAPFFNVSVFVSDPFTQN